MKSVNVSNFTRHCSGLLAEARLTGEPIQILKRGKPLAMVYPDEGNSNYHVGAFRDAVKIVGELMIDGSDLGVQWEALA